MKLSFIPHATHAEAVGALAAVQWVDAARVEVKADRVVVAFGFRRRGPIEAIGVRVEQLSDNETAHTRSRQEQ